MGIPGNILFSQSEANWNSKSFPLIATHKGGETSLFICVNLPVISTPEYSPLIKLYLFVFSAPLVEYGRTHSSIPPMKCKLCSISYFHALDGDGIRMVLRPLREAAIRSSSEHQAKS
jgi:hypothetical protein